MGKVQYSTAEVLARLVDVLCCVAQTVPPAEVLVLPSRYLSKLLGSLLCRGVFEKCAGFRGGQAFGQGDEVRHKIIMLIKS